MIRRLSGSIAVAAIAAFGLLAAAPAPSLGPSLSTQGNPTVLHIDARMAGRGLMRVHEIIPAQAGEFTVVYPEWIPGEHGPTVPLEDLSVLRFSANGKQLDWVRDGVDLYAFHVDVPTGVTSITADFMMIINAPDAMSTRNLAILNFNRALLYQANTNSHQDYFKTSVTLPSGWDYGTALPSTHTGDTVVSQVLPLATLVDSPFDMGRYVKHVALWKDASGDDMTLDMFADSPRTLDIPEKILAPYHRVAPEALALYGGHHWQHYHSLLTLSDPIGYEGIEHHSSSDDRAPADFMTALGQLTGGDLLTHEFSHSWNGKYRRPADLTTPNFQVPQKTDLLWVYEGMNQYLGDLLSFRSGIRKPSEYPEYLASIYASMDYEPGRLHTPIIDLTTGAPYYYVARGAYSSLRRTGGDFYTEGELMWLDADTIIRQKSGGKKSLDDFLHLYAGGVTPYYVTKTYDRAQIEALLNRVQPYDWHGFFQKYVYSVAVHPPTDMIARSGWKLEYTTKPNTFIKARAEAFHSVPLWYSMGTNIGGNGQIFDVRKGSAAWNAGLAPGMEIMAVNGEAFEGQVLEDAITASVKSKAPISLLVSRDGWFDTIPVTYTGGLLYPHLVREKSQPDLLAKIMAPHAPK
ncbi:MAG: M61 family metallopeptidase [Vulcanimicrobiaceae bacterium]